MTQQNTKQIEQTEQAAKAALKSMLPEHSIAEIDRWIKKYPADRKRPPIIAALTIAQKQNGNWLSNQLMQAVAAYLDVPDIAVYEVATFYSMYHLKPMGRHVISVCTNLSCSLRGSQQIVEHLQQELGIQLGETTADGLFTLKEVECMAACAGAPMLEVNEIFHENLNQNKVTEIIQQLRASCQSTYSEESIDGK